MRNENISDTTHREHRGAVKEPSQMLSLSLGHVLKVAAKKRLMRSLLFLSYINYYTPTAYILACKRAHDAAILCGFHMQKKKMEYSKLICLHFNQVVN